MKRRICPEAYRVIDKPLELVWVQTLKDACVICIQDYMVNDRVEVSIILNAIQ